MSADDAARVQTAARRRETNRLWKQAARAQARAEEDDALPVESAKERKNRLLREKYARNKAAQIAASAAAAAVAAEAPVGTGVRRARTEVPNLLPSPPPKRRDRNDQSESDADGMEDAAAPAAMFAELDEAAPAEEPMLPAEAPVDEPMLHADEPVLDAPQAQAVAAPPVDLEVPFLEADPADLPAFIARVTSVSRLPDTLAERRYVASCFGFCKFDGSFDLKVANH